MITVSNAAGGLTPRGALARGVSLGLGLTGLMDIGASNHPASDIARWQGTAVASALGQLAVTASGASTQLLRSCCGVIKQRTSVAGIESIFLSALLGTPDGAPELESADAAWAALTSPQIADDRLIPILDPAASELCFVSPRDLTSMTGLALKAQLSTLRASRAASPGEAADQLAFAAAVLVAATAVMSASVLSRLPDTDPDKSAVLAALGPGGGSDGLPAALVRGLALLVGTELLADNGDVSGPSPPAGWNSVWPIVEALPIAEDPSTTLMHPYWKTSGLCPSLPITGAALTGQVLRRYNTLVLQSVPRIALDGTVTAQGFYPKPAAPAPAPPPDDDDWRATIGELYLPHVDSGAQRLIGGVLHSPASRYPGLGGVAGRRGLRCVGSLSPRFRTAGSRPALRSGRSSTAWPRPTTRPAAPANCSGASGRARASRKRPAEPVG